MTTDARKNAHETALKEVLERYSRDFSDFDGLVLSTPDQCGHGEDAPLHIAARHGLQRDIVVLASAGAPLNQPGDLGFTPLHNAAMAGRAEVAKQLVKLGANPQVLNDFGQTAAEVATLGGHEDLAIFLRDLASSR